MKWIPTQSSLPKSNQECLILVHNHTDLVFLAQFDRDNPFIQEVDKNKFWIKDEHGAYSADPLKPHEIRAWLPMPKQWFED